MIIVENGRKWQKIGKIKILIFSNYSSIFYRFSFYFKKFNLSKCPYFVVADFD